MSYIANFLTQITAMVGVEYMTLIVIALTLVLFAVDKLPMGFVAMLSAVTLALLGCMPIAQIYAGWSSSLVIVLMGMMIIGDAMFQTGAVLIVGRTIMKSKFAHNERAVMAIIMLLSGILSAFLANAAVVATFIPLVGALCVSSNGKLHQKYLMMPLGFAASIGGTLTVIGSTSQPMVNTVLEGQGLQTMGIFDIWWVAFPSFLFLIVYMVTIGYKLMQKSCNFEDVIMDSDNSKMENFQPTRKTWISIGVLIFCCIGYFSGVWNNAVIALIGASVCILTGCVEFKEAFRRIDWNSITVMAFAQGIATAMNVSGAGAMVANWVVDLVGNNLAMQMVGCVAVITVLTNIMSNTATAAMMMPIYIMIAQQLGVSYFPFAIAIAVATNLTAATPIGGTAITMTAQAGYRFSDYVKVGTPLNIVWAALTIIMTLVLFPF